MKEKTKKGKRKLGERERERERKRESVEEQMEISDSNVFRSTLQTTHTRRCFN